jgi:hypothetical protein
MILHFFGLGVFEGFLVLCTAILAAYFLGNNFFFFLINQAHYIFLIVQSLAYIMFCLWVKSYSNTIFTQKYKFVKDVQHLK